MPSRQPKKKSRQSKRKLPKKKPSVEVEKSTQSDDGYSRPPRETDGWKPTLEPGGILVEDPIVFPEKLRYDLSSDDIVAAPDADYVLALPHKPRRPTTVAEVMRNVVEAFKRETERRKEFYAGDKFLKEILAE
jgi:hypothetical protein